MADTCWMKRTTVALALVAAAAAVTPQTTLAQSTNEGRARAVNLENPSPQTARTFRTLDDRTMDLSQYRGRPVMLHYWASWCAPCIVELPYVDDLAGAYDPEDIAIVAVSVDRKRKAVRRFLKRRKLEHLDAWIDFSGDSLDDTGETGIPLTIFYDANGVETVRLRGTFDWSDPAARKIIDTFIADSKAL